MALPCSFSRCRQSQEKKRSHRVFRLGRRKIKFNPCFPGACTSENTLCSLQVCERLPQASARSRLKPLLSAKPLGFVDSLKNLEHRKDVPGFLLFVASGDDQWPWPFSAPPAPTPKCSSFMPSTSSQIPLSAQMEQSVGRPSRIVARVFTASLDFLARSFMAL